HSTRSSSALPSKPLQVCLALFRGLVKIFSNSTPSIRFRNKRACSSPFFVKERSVTLVCCPDKLHSVSPCLQRYTRPILCLLDRDNGFFSVEIPRSARTFAKLHIDR